MNLPKKPFLGRFNISRSLFSFDALFGKQKRSFKMLAAFIGQFFLFSNPAFAAVEASGGATAILGKTSNFMMGNVILSFITRMQSAFFMNYNWAVYSAILIFTFHLKMVEFPFYKKMIESEMVIRDMMSKYAGE
jgi:hypothetical protein